MSEQELNEQFEQESLEEASPQEESAPPPPTEVEAPSTFDIGGRQFTREQLEPFVQFSDYVQQNPDYWNDLQAWGRGERVLVPAEDIEYVDDEPEYFDEDDDIGRIRAEMGEMAQRMEQLAQAQDRQIEAYSRRAMHEGAQAFSQAHPDLTEEDLDRVARATGPLIITYLQRDPMNPDQALRWALEAGYKLEFFDRQQQQGAQQVVRDLNQRRRAASVGTSGGSAPRSEPEPQTRQEHFDAMVKAIADAQAAGE